MYGPTVLAEGNLRMSHGSEPPPSVTVAHPVRSIARMVSLLEPDLSVKDEHGAIIKILIFSFRDAQTSLRSSLRWTLYFSLAINDYCAAKSTSPSTSRRHRCRRNRRLPAKKQPKIHRKVKPASKGDGGQVQTSQQSLPTVPPSPGPQQIGSI